MTARLASLAFALAGTASGQRFAISQARAELPSITVFLDAPAMTAPSLEATYGNQRLRVTSLARFDRAASGVAYIVLADASASLGAREFAELREALRALIENLGPRDRVAVIRFGDTADLISDFTADRAALEAKLSGLKPLDNRTVLHVALERAIEMAKRLDPGLPERRAAIVLSDGKDEGSGITADDVVRQIDESRLPIYSIGFSRLAASERTRYFDVLKRFALYSGGDFFEAKSAGGIREAYERAQAAITNVLVAHLVCDACAGSGRLERLQITLRADGRVLSDGIDLRVLPAVQPPLKQQPAAPRPRIPIWAYVAAAAAAFLLLAAFVIRRRVSQRTTAAEPETPRPTIPEPPARVQFVVVRGDRPGAVYDLPPGPRTVVGSGADTNLRLTAEATIAARQFEVETLTGTIVIRHLGGAQATHVNGAAIRSQHPIAHGDLISVGATDLRVVVSR